MRANLKRFLHVLAMWALIAPFLVHSLVAATVMPTGSAEGPVLVICTGDGPLEMVMDPLTGKPVHKDSDDRSNPCSWAKGAVVTILVLPVSALAITGSSTAAHLPAAPFVLTAAQETGLPPSTGPPSVL